MGSGVGVNVGDLVGSTVGSHEGLSVGSNVGSHVGSKVGSNDGDIVVGPGVGAYDGLKKDEGGEKVGMVGNVITVVGEEIDGG